MDDVTAAGITGFAGDLKIVQACENGIEIQFEQKICPEINGIIGRVCKAINNRDFKNQFYIEEAVPAYCSILILFDKEKCSVRELLQKIPGIVKAAAEKSPDSENQAGQSGKKSGGEDRVEDSFLVHEIPVCYEEEFAPDMHNVCEHSGLSEKEVIALHSGREYPVYMLGFLPGFAYLGGMDEKLNTPRLKVPRTKIPAGSVAIGGAQTGIYPVESPGGWQIIGRTPVKTFDPGKTPSVLFNAGDRIRFVPVTKERFLELEKSEGQNKSGEINQGAESYVCTGGIKILNGGFCTTVQDEGRKNCMSLGLSENGAMDKASFYKANHLVGNKADVAVLEAVVLGPEISFNTDCDFAITGADIQPELDGTPVKMNEKIHGKAGSILKTGFAVKGMRSYIAFGGGILVKTVLGSKSTNLKCGFGGYSGRKLKTDDEIPLGDAFEALSFEKNKETSVPDFSEDFSLERGTGNSVVVIKVTKGAQFEGFSKEAVDAFFSAIYEIAPESDRMGIRLKGKALEWGSTDIISDGIPFGAVQITSSGLPVIMGPDRQTCGGYAKIACVVREDMYRLAQCIPGTKIKFSF